MKTWILAYSLILVSIGHAQNSVDPILDRIAQVDRFAFGGTGYAGVMSSGEKDYRAILSRPSAATDFATLFVIGNSQGKSYALMGIRTLNPNRFKQISRHLRGSTEEVVTQSGCIVYHETFGTILKRIDAGTYSLYGNH